MKITIEVDGKTIIREFDNSEWNYFLKSTDNTSRTIRSMLVEAGEYIKDEDVDKYAFYTLQGVSYKRLKREEPKDDERFEHREWKN